MTAKNVAQTGKSDSAPVQRKPNPRHRFLVVDDDPFGQAGTDAYFHEPYGTSKPDNADADASFYQIDQRLF